MQELLDGRLEQLVDSLLYEGYALYPYTPEATKNATPTPFGIVYPPAYAGRMRGRPSTTRGSSACAAGGTGDQRHAPLPARRAASVTEASEQPG